MHGRLDSFRSSVVGVLDVDNMHVADKRQPCWLHPVSDHVAIVQMPLCSITRSRPQGPEHPGQRLLTRDAFPKVGGCETSAPPAQTCGPQLTVVQCTGSHARVQWLMDA